jgi:hypothetical protein
MRRGELQKELSIIAEKKNTAAYKDQENRHQVLLNELFIKIINDFNESTIIYNRWLIVLTIIIAFLTIAMLLKQ